MHRQWKIQPKENFPCEFADTFDEAILNAQEYANIEGCDVYVGPYEDDDADAAFNPVWMAAPRNPYR